MDATAVPVNYCNCTSVLLVGVCLLSDGSAEQLSCLGMVVVPQTVSSIDQLPVSTLRQTIKEQIPTCPPSFRFYTAQRWPITRSQEDSLTLQNLMTADGSVYIQQVHDKPKIGIKAKTGTSFGFLFTDTLTSLADFRSLVNTEVSNCQELQDTYQFLDANCWPVSRQLEKDITVREAMVNCCIVICTDSFTKGKDNSDDCDRGSVLSASEPPRKRLRGLQQLSFRSGKDVDRQRTAVPALCREKRSDSVTSAAATPTMCSKQQTSPHSDKKQLLISYVRAEAADYALQLKIKLAELGYSVYLDVHEISVGVDWQDSLNFAVSNCEVFIPLVTPRYGETLWTNREVKLADVLGKFILPVNFLLDWPPRCLAIQFATTQYVLSGPSHTQALDSTTERKTWMQTANWIEADIKSTAREISQRLKAVNKTGATLLSIPSLVRMKTLRKTFVGKLPAVKSFVSESESDIASQNNNRPLIVICLHPSQATFGQGVKLWLENKSYTVWLSSEDRVPENESNILTSVGTDFEHRKGDSSGFNGDGSDLITPFQSVADRAALVVVILSKDFALSHTCKQQLFYCEQRKPLVPVHFEDFTMPGWLSMLIGTESSASIKQSNYKQTLLSRVQRVLHSATRNNLEQLGNEAKLNHAVEYIRKMVETDSCVYIAGSTDFSTPRSKEICRAIGVQLAQLEGVSIATGGFYGVGQTVSLAFCEEVQRLQKRQDVWHIMPDRDVKDWKKQANQNADGTFAVALFGKTLFCGDSVRQRESVVGRCFEICILIEGGPGAAQETEEFVWNDRTVIPLCCTGGTVSGKFSVPQKTFEMPQGVSTDDWEALTNQDLTPDQVAESVAHIVSSLLKHLSASKQQATNGSKSPEIADSTPIPLSLGNKTSPPVAAMKTSSPPTHGKVKNSLNKMKTVILG